MEKYLGVKIIEAEPMKRELMRIGVPQKTEDGYKVVYEDGYTSWSPKDSFEKAYRRIDNLTFGLALEALKQGKAVARKGWNGKGMCILLHRGSIDPQVYGFAGTEHPKHPHGSTIDGVDMGLFDLGDVGTVTRLPNIDMMTASGTMVRGWLASQTDMLAEDWCIVEFD